MVIRLELVKNSLDWPLLKQKGPPTGLVGGAFLKKSHLWVVGLLLGGYFAGSKLTVGRPTWSGTPRDRKQSEIG